jgi:Ran GTPase-activating protein (RanGAP) involved in mRNA processing and transport
MLDRIPMIWWKHYLSLLPTHEAWQFICRLSTISTNLYNISKTIKGHDSFESLRKIYIPHNAESYLIQYTLAHFAKQYNNSPKWIVYMRADEHETRVYSISEIIINTSPIFNIAIYSNGEKIHNIKSVERIFYMVPECIISLDLHSAKLSNSKMSTLISSFGNVQQLTSLNLAGNSLGCGGAKLLAPYISNLTQLELLDLGYNKIKTDGFESLIPSFAQLSQLKTLHLCNNEIHNEGIALFATIRLSNLTTLNLVANNLRKGDEHMSQCLDTMAQLISLDLSCNYITNFTKINKSLEKMINLQSLKLSYNRINAPIAISIIQTIAKLPHIKKIILSSNFIENGGAICIISYLEKIPQLELLDLQDNIIHESVQNMLKVKIKSFGHNKLTVLLNN